MSQANQIKISFDVQEACYVCHGEWSISNLAGLLTEFKQIPTPKALKTIINGKNISVFDSAGALAIIRCMNQLNQDKKEVELKNFSPSQLLLIELVQSQYTSLLYEPPILKSENILHRIGEEAINKLNQADGVIVLIGDLSIKLFEAIITWRRFHLPNIVSNIYSAGIQALPIVALLSFLIGVVLAYQMGLQLQTYGANIFIAYISGMAIFREFSPLITAIIVAGRTSSAFTAQIGSMKINEEIDALYTMGLSPTELLVVPKMLGLVLVFPLLIFWSDVFSVLGAMFMSKTMLQVGYVDFLNRLRDSVGLKQMMLGLYKAPVFALIVSLVGCFQGFEVQSSADNIGSQTTKSVVQALFLIIVADAAFSIVYSWMKI
ncbi:MAG: ABC transporter permease [Legionellales bacterium RIFCSPHIGHO2_12_FULL_42_9]|nr:MAG: ABC transporter permease [Legionellales bacterium RIFCSPHIGHO2_12_FULL_42_9]